MGPFTARWEHNPRVPLRCASVPGAAQTPRPRLPPITAGSAPKAPGTPVTTHPVHTQHQHPSSVRSGPLCTTDRGQRGRKGCAVSACGQVPAVLSPAASPISNGAPQNTPGLPIPPPAGPSHAALCARRQRGGRPCRPPQREGGPSPRCAPGRRQTEHGICTAKS